MLVTSGQLKVSAEFRMGGLVDRQSWRWIGGANIPTRHGTRVNADIPLAELSVNSEIVTLRLRGVFSRLFRAEMLQSAPSDLVSIFPIRAVLRFRGVGFERRNGDEYYFKTTRIDEILAVLDSRDFPVSLESRSAAKLWKGVP